jgi:hypothetical protein
MAIRILQRDFGTADLRLEHCTIFQVACLPQTHISPKYHKGQLRLEDQYLEWHLKAVLQLPQIFLLHMGLWPDFETVLE